jgi:hypothetical protein
MMIPPPSDLQAFGDAYHPKLARWQSQVTKEGQIATRHIDLDQKPNATI